MAKYFEIKRFNAPTGVWTPITVPIECSRIVFENTGGVACAIRTNADEGGSEKSIPSLMELTVQAVAPCFMPGDVVGYVNPASGTSTIVVSYTR